MPAVLDVMVDRAVAAGSAVEVYFSALQNPSSYSYRFRVSGRVMAACGENDMSALCPAYQVHKYYTLSATSTASLVTQGSFSATPSTVHLTASQTYSNPAYTAPAGSLVRVVFNANVQPP